MVEFVTDTIFRMVNLLPYPDDIAFLKTAHSIYRHYGKHTQALALAIRLNDLELIQEDFDATEDESIKKQMAFMIGRQQIWLNNEDETLAECLNNTHLASHFQYLAKELNILEPKKPEDIYKTHLEHSRSGASNVDSAKQNLASTFVNAFVNVGFGNDKLMLGKEETSPWVYRNKDLGE